MSIAINLATFHRFQMIQAKFAEGMNDFSLIAKYVADVSDDDEFQSVTEFSSGPAGNEFRYMFCGELFRVRMIASDTLLQAGLIKSDKINDFDPTRREERLKPTEIAVFRERSEFAHQRVFTNTDDQTDSTLGMIIVLALSGDYEFDLT